MSVEDLFGIGHEYVGMTTCDVISIRYDVSVIGLDHRGVSCNRHPVMRILRVYTDR